MQPWVHKTATKLGCCFQQAGRSIRQKPAIFVIASLAIAVALLVFELLLLTSINVDQLTGDWNRGAQIGVFFDRGTKISSITNIEKMMSSSTLTNSTHIVSPKESYETLKKVLQARGENWLDAQHLTLLPYRLDIQLNLNATKKDIEQLIALLSGLAAVDEVDIVDSWGPALGDLSASIRWLVFIMAVVSGIALVAIVAVMMRIVIDSRREDLTTQKLLGATTRFLSIPFILEGVLISLIGAMVANFALLGIFYYLAEKTLPILTLFNVSSHLSFLPSHYLVGLVCIFPMIFGGLGSLVAVRTVPRG